MVRFRIGAGAEITLWTATEPPEIAEIRLWTVTEIIEITEILLTFTETSG